MVRDLEEIRSFIHGLQRRSRSIVLAEFLLVLCGCVAAGVLVAAAAGLLGWSHPVLAVALAVLVLGTPVFWTWSVLIPRHGPFRDEWSTGRQIDRQTPELGNVVLSALEVVPGGRPLPQFSEDLTAALLAHAARRIPP